MTQQQHRLLYPFRSFIKAGCREAILALTAVRLVLPGWGSRKLEWKLRPELLAQSGPS